MIQISSQMSGGEINFLISLDSQMKKIKMYQFLPPYTSIEISDG